MGVVLTHAIVPYRIIYTTLENALLSGNYTTNYTMYYVVTLVICLLSKCFESNAGNLGNANGEEINL